MAKARGCAYLVRICVLVLLMTTGRIIAQQQPSEIAQSATVGQSSVPTLEVNAPAVTLDVIVTGKNGAPVSGLTKDDFTLLEDGQPQTIADFHAINVQGERAHNAELQAARAILLIDEMNTRLADVAYTRDSLSKLFSQNDGKLDQPTMLLALTNDGLVVLQDYTRDGHALEGALNRHQNAVPYRLGLGSNGALERINISLNTLQQIAVSSQGIPGHKTIVWITAGLPILQTWILTPEQQRTLFQTIQTISDELLMSRITLDTVDPRGSESAESQ